MKNYIILLTAVAIFATACNKVTFEEQNNNTGKLSFYNASNQLDALLSSSGTGQKIVMTLTPQSAQSPFVAGSLSPVFSGGSSVVNPVRDFPAASILDATPYTVFQNYSSGSYQFNGYFNTVSSTNLFTFNIQAEKGTRSAYLLADSAGKYSVTTAPFTEPGAAGKTKLRLIQLSPDCDSANVKINTIFQAGKFQNMRYRNVSPFVSYDMPKDSLLRIRVFRGKDTLNIIGRIDLTVQPGVNYNLILRGYVKNHAVNQFGNTTAVVQNSTIDVRRAL